MVSINTKKETGIQDIARTYDLRLLFLFGSQVTGNTHKESDFDFGYIANRPLSLQDEGRLIGELMRIAETNDERAINLVNIKNARPLLRYAAADKAQLLYEERAGIFADFQAYAFRAYVEVLPLFALKAERLGIRNQ